MTSNLQLYKKIILFVLTLFAANPIIIYLLTKNVNKTIFICLTVTSIIQATYSYKRLKLLTVYLFNFVVLISILIHAEVLINYVFPDSVPKNLYTIRDGYSFNRPLIDEKFQSPEFSSSYKTNIQGFRIPIESDPYRTIDECDWLVIGDSFTQGAQVNYEDLFTSKLSDNFPERIIVNSGISGMGIGQEFNYFIKEGHRLSPKLIILQLSSFNDFFNVDPPKAELTDKLMGDWSILRLIFSDLRYTKRADLPLGRWTEPFQADDLANKDFNIFYNKSSPHKEYEIRRFKQYVEKFRDAAKSIGAELLITLIPSKEQVYEHNLNEVIEAFSIKETELDMNRPNDLLNSLGADLNIDIIDLLPDFKASKSKMFFPIDEHLTKKGHSVMAQSITNFLNDQKNITSKVKKVSTGYNYDRYPSFIHNGEKICFQSIRGNNNEIIIGNSNLSSLNEITSNSLNETHPSVSKNTGKIIFTLGNAETFNTKICIMNLDGTNREIITNKKDEYGAIPTFSKSGKKITYPTWSLNGPKNKISEPKIVIRNLENDSIVEITDGEHECWRPVISPDEKTVVYIKKIDTQFDIYQYDITSGVESKITSTTYDEWDPQFSPDGSSLVYAANKNNNWDLFLVNLNNLSVSQLTDTIGDEWDPCISPDGSTIIFAGTFGLFDSIYSMQYPIN